MLVHDLTSKEMKAYRTNSLIINLALVGKPFRILLLCHIYGH